MLFFAFFVYYLRTFSLKAFAPRERARRLAWTTIRRMAIWAMVAVARQGKVPNFFCRAGMARIVVLKLPATDTKETISKLAPKRARVPRPVDSWLGDSHSKEEKAAPIPMARPVQPKARQMPIKEAWSNSEKCMSRAQPPVSSKN